MSTLVNACPNTIAEALTGRDYVSFSAISTYRRCPLQYCFRYIEGLPEETVSASLVFGGAIHAVAEFHFNQMMAGSTPPDLDTLLDVYRNAWNTKDQATIRFGKGDDVGSLGRLAERMIVAFQQSDVARPEGAVLGVEEELRGAVIEGCPDLLARVDLLVDDGESLVVTDLKTARSRWSQGQVEDSAEQLVLYGELARELAPDRPIRLDFAVITKTKEPAVTVHPVRVDAKRIERTKEVVRRVWRAIEARSFFPTPSPMNCTSCPCRSACRDWRG